MFTLYFGVGIVYVFVRRNTRIINHLLEKIYYFLVPRRDVLILLCINVCVYTFYAGVNGQFLKCKEVCISCKNQNTPSKRRRFMKSKTRIRKKRK